MKMRRPTLSVCLALVVAAGLGGGAARAIVSIGANIRGDSLQGFSGKVAGIGTTFEDGNLVDGRPGLLRTSVQSTDSQASVDVSLRQKTMQGNVTLDIRVSSLVSPRDPASGNLATRMLIHQVQAVTDHIFHTGQVPQQLPEGMQVRLDLNGPKGSFTPADRNTVRTFLERHFILGLASLSGNYAHRVETQAGPSPANSSSVQFGPDGTNGTPDVTKLSTEVKEVVP